MERVAVGRVIRPRGIRGEVIAEIYSLQPGRAESFREITLERNGITRVVGVEEVWFHDGKPIFKFAGIDSIDDAAEWSGADMLVPETERLVPEPGEYTYEELIGCSVVGEKPVGKVTGVEEYGGP